MDERSLFILTWLEKEHKNITTNVKIQPIVNDASQRKYYRYTVDNTSYIVMDSKQDPSLHKFIAIARQFFAWGLSAPEIYKIDYEHSLILMRDFGNDLYLNKLTINTADQLYLAALQTLVKLQSNIVPETLALSLMDVNYIQDRLAVFEKWFIQKHLNLAITATIQQLLANLAQLFRQIFLGQPQVLVHLDYHSRNLMVLPEPQPGILDFQDAMIGPIVYDVVSLLQDAYIQWPRGRIEEWLGWYQDLAMAAGIISSKEPQQFIKLFDLVGVHRHLKNLGVFARLHHRDGKSKYLQDMPVLLNYIIETCRRYAELQELLLFFETQVLPAFYIGQGSTLCKL